MIVIFAEYVNMLTQIIETMNYTADVEQFMEVSSAGHLYISLLSF